MTSDESHDSSVPNPAEKRRHQRHQRYQVAVQVELYPEGATAPLRTATTETSLGGCYVETMFTFPVGTLLGLTLWLGDKKVTTRCRVATCFPQVGNGLEFVGLGADNQKQLERFLAENETHE
jgi:c-di-GMP-binding flagellar brake protein YcgR